MVKAAPALPGSKICADHSKNHLEGEDKFRISHPDTKWETGLEHGAKIGLGSTEYELINI
jgi:uncharacterized Fe-S center protein